MDRGWKVGEQGPKTEICLKLRGTPTGHPWQRAEQQRIAMHFKNNHQALCSRDWIDA